MPRCSEPQPHDERQRPARRPIVAAPSFGSRSPPRTRADAIQQGGPQRPVRSEAAPLPGPGGRCRSISMHWAGCAGLSWARIYGCPSPPLRTEPLEPREELRFAWRQAPRGWFDEVHRARMVPPCSLAGRPARPLPPQSAAELRARPCRSVATATAFASRSSVRVRCVWLCSRSVAVRSPSDPTTSSRVPRCERWLQ